jgi:uroporphyrinogen III methyltransferase/synthase
VSDKLGGMRPGLVSFVGAGPGDPGLHTARATQRLAEADVVFEDEVPDGRLVDLAREGKRVVRLVAGDALESSAVVAQARVLAASGVPFEVVPGVGARGAVAAFAGVLGRAVRVPVGEVEAALASEAPDAVVTIVVGAGTPSQRVVTTTAGEGAHRARALGAGEVIVAFGAPEEALRWAERRPLFGKRVLVTRARDQAGSTAALLREQGAEPVVVPTIEIHPPGDPAPLAAALGVLGAGGYDWVTFTSANGVDRTWAALAAAGWDARAFGATRVAAIGPATASALERRGIRADVVAREFRGEALAAAMLSGGSHSGGAAARVVGDGGAAVRALGERPRVLLARAAVARDVLPETLREAGWVVDVVPVYETRPTSDEVVERLTRELAGGHIDAVTFTSSSTVDSLCDRLGSRAAELLAGPRLASIGPLTTATAVGRGLRVDVTARTYTVPGLIDALVESYG